MLGRTRIYKKKTSNQRTRKKQIIRRNPKWFYPTTWDYIIAQYANVHRAKKYYKKLYCDEINYCMEAKHLETTIHKDFQFRTVKSPSPFVAVLKDGCVWGKNAFVFSREHKQIQDVSFEFRIENFKKIKKHFVFKKWKSHPPQYFPGNVAVLTFCSAQNYFHWMFDILPRIDLLRQSNIQIDRYIINRKSHLPFQDETLVTLGIPNEKIIETNNKFQLQAKKLIVPSLVNHYIIKPHTYVRPYAIPKWVCDFLRKELLLKTKSDFKEQNEYIYISRENAWVRKILNEEEIMNFLAVFGFKLINLELMTVAQQIQLFASAKVIVAPHGAGLANLVFCRPATKVIEIFSHKYMPAYYWMISNHVHLDYYYMVNEVEDSSLASSDFSVNIGKLLEVLKLAGLSTFEKP